MTHRVLGLLVGVTLLGLVETGSAQQPVLPPTVDSGRMVRMYTATTMLEGRLLAPYRGADSSLSYCRAPGRPCLGIEDSAAMRTIPVRALQRLEVSPGSQWRRGATIGGVFGAVAGGLAGAFIFAMCEQDCPSSKTPIVVLGGITNGLAFGALGALWGSAFPRWERRR